MRVLITGGGTGGHINPGIAIANYIRGRLPGSEIAFVGTETGLEYKLVPREGYKLYTIDIQGLKRGFKISSILGNVKTSYKLLASITQCNKILKDFKPDIVIGTGGYVSFPLVYSASSLKIPCIILEVNALPGVATKRLVKRVDKVLICFENTRSYLGNPSNAFLTGAPVREGLVMSDPHISKKKLGVLDRPLVVSFWGSLGAHYMNKKMVDYIKLASLQNDFYHIHATGHKSYDWFMDDLRESGVNLKNTLVSVYEYIYNMDEVLAAADLVICRAGAGTLSEICALGKPSIIIPSPFVAENHQEKNARALEECGACTVLLENESTGNTIYDSVLSLINDRNSLKDMGISAFNMSSIDGIYNIYNEVTDILKSKGNK